MTLLVASASVAVAAAGSGLFVWALWPLVARTTARSAAAVRARVIFAWRVLPLGFAVVAGVVVLSAFVAFEPPDADETAGVSLVALAVAGASLLLVGLARGAGSFAASVRLSRRWVDPSPAVAVPGLDTPARVVECAFPLAAVVGFRRPRLVLARSVATRCSPDELAAIAAHERGHVIAGDNWRRLVMQSIVDPLSWTRRGSSMSTAWHEAAEEAADDHASASGACHVELASALVTVSQLAAAGAPSLRAAGLLFYAGNGVERRVRRLLGQAGRAQMGRPGRLPAWARGAASATVFSLLLAMAVTAAGSHVHRAAEWFVQRMP